MIKLNTYNSVKEPSVQSTIDIEEYFSRIKNGWDKHNVQRARLYSKNDSIYNNIKLNRECVTLNFLFNSYKNNNNISSPTGIIYFDIDDPNFKIEMIDDNKVFCYHKSFGGLGWTILCKVTDLSLDNYKDTFNFISEELGIGNFVDNGAKKVSQYTILSYDPEIYVNYNAKVFAAKHNTKKVSYASNNNKNIDMRTNDTFLDNKYDLFINPPNIEEDSDSTRFITSDAYLHVPQDKDYIVYEDGIKVNKIKLPKINTGGRYNFLSTTCNRIIYLNPKISLTHLKKYMQGINSYCCVNPLEDEELERIINYRWHNKKDIKVIPNHTRKIIFSDDFKGDKKKIVGKEVGRMRREKTLSEIYSIIENWDFENYGKITQKKVGEVSEKSTVTIKRYWKEFKDYVKQLNIENK